MRRTAVITGSASGIGTALCRRLAGEGWDLVLVNRDPEKGKRQADDLRRQHPALVVDCHVADLSDHGDIVRVCRTIALQKLRVEAVFLNAGVLLPSLIYSKQGNEMHFEVNTVAPFLFVHGLRQSLARAGRSVVVASGSGARRMGPLVVDQLKSPARFQKMVGPYAQSKQALALSFQELGPQFAQQGIELRVVDLPPTKTAMAEGEGMPSLFRGLRFLFVSPERAADRLVRALESDAPRAEATAPGLLALLESTPALAQLRTA